MAGLVKVMREFKSFFYKNRIKLENKIKKLEQEKICPACRKCSWPCAKSLPKRSLASHRMASSVGSVALALMLVVSPDTSVAAGEAEITQSANQAREDLRATVASLAVLGARQILEKEVDEETHRELLDKLIAEI